MAQAASDDESPAPIRFVLDGEVVTPSAMPPTRTVLQYLREDLGRTGTKEGCAEGDCGACTVVVAELDHAGGLRHRAVNACVQFVPTLDGKELITVESLARDGTLHPVQRAMVDHHASQCGFCTPGFVMSLYALYEADPQPAQSPSRAAINDALAGNLCRCTGYRPIVDAAQKMYAYGASADRPRRTAERIARLQALRRRAPLALTYGAAGAGDGATYHAPQSLAELARLRAAHPRARLLAGGTDVGLWVTKRHQDIPHLIYLGGVAELQRVAQVGDVLEIGAAVTIADLAPLLARHVPDLGELLRRFASPPIRNAATLGGNIANGSPIGDSMPALIALGARLVLRRGAQQRALALEDFYLGYQKTALQDGEFVECIRLPLPAAPCRFRTYKVAKRYDQDISAVCAAFAIELDGARITAARVAFGGMAATPSRARACEAALVGREWTRPTAVAAAAALGQDYAPISDMRASARYRTRVAHNLLLRFHLETTGHPAATRLLDLAPLAAQPGAAA